MTFSNVFRLEKLEVDKLKVLEESFISWKIETCCSSGDVVVIDVSGMPGPF